MTFPEAIFQTLGALGGAVVGSFFPAKYPEARMSRELWRRLSAFAASHPSRGSLSVALSRLQAQGLVSRHGPKRYARWLLTAKGRARLAAAKQRAAPSPATQKDGVPRLVIFDVPERERAKREFIRRTLTAAGFRQLQKSVWWGREALPPNFIGLVERLRLGEHVHIFSVRETGTLPDTHDTAY